MKILEKRGRKPKIDRNLAICDAINRYDGTKTRRQIAEDFGISESRLKRIVDKYWSGYVALKK